MPASPKMVFLLGKPPTRRALFPAVFARLREAGVGVETMLPHSDPGFDPRALLGVDLVVQRGLRSAVLAGLEAIEQAGVRFCNSVAASRLVRDRERLSRHLAAAGLPVPRAVRVADWRAARAAAGGRDVVLKAVDGGHGRGAGVVFVRGDDWPREVLLDGPLLVEPRIPNDGFDRKLYVAGDACRGLLKRWPRDTTTPAAPFTPDTALASLARRVGTSLDLEIFGVDVVLGAAGPVIVDVNPFPSFEGIADAPRLIGAHLLRIARPDGPPSA